MATHQLADKFKTLAALCTRDAEDAKTDIERMELLRRAQAFHALASTGFYLNERPPT